MSGPPSVVRTQSNYISSDDWLQMSNSDKSNFTLGELASTGILETLSEFLDENSLSTDLGEKKSKRVRFSCDNENPCKIAHTTWK